MPGQDSRPPLAGITTPRGEQAESQAVTGIDMSRCLAYRKPPPGADSILNLCDLSAGSGILVTYAVHLCVITETHPVDIMIRRDRCTQDHADTGPAPVMQLAFTLLHWTGEAI